MFEDRYFVVCPHLLPCFWPQRSRSSSLCCGHSRKVRLYIVVPVVLLTAALGLYCGSNRKFENIPCLMYSFLSCGGKLKRWSIHGVSSANLEPPICSRTAAWVFSLVRMSFAFSGIHFSQSVR